MNTLRGIRDKSLRDWLRSPGLYRALRLAGDSRRRALTTALRAMNISLAVRDV